VQFIDEICQKPYTICMSLTANDLSEIRNIVQSALAGQTDDEIKPIMGELRALRNDVKEIYDTIFELQHSSITDKRFQKLSLKKKLLTINAELLSAAKQAGITLPRQ
jgi:ABC-type phosphate transport system auxiliary subunit